MKRLKRIPKFRLEDEEREFWAKADSTEYIDWRKGRKVVFSDLKPTTRSISIRLPEYLIGDLKRLANKMDVPYQSLIKMMLMEGLSKKAS
jgi:predicted DNA binding CopG/RHH family protein